MNQIIDKFSKEIQSANQILKQQMNNDQLQLNLFSAGNEIRIQVKSPRGVSKVSSSLCCVVDVSDSMNVEVVQNTGNRIEEIGYSVLDIVKHSLCTIAANMDEKDNFSLVTFSDRAQEIVNIDSMTESNKQVAIQKIIQCSPQGGTNIWAGIEQGLKTLKKSQQLENQQQLIVFSDGKSNINPPRGIIPSINKLYRNEFQVNKPQINTLGYGDQVDTDLLLKVAKEFQGNYSFIHDSSFVGTVLVNAIAAIQSSFATNTVLVFKPLHSSASMNLNQIKSNFKCYWNSSGEIFVELGNLLFDQSKDILVTQSIHSELLKDYSVSVSYDRTDTKKSNEKSVSTASSIENANVLEFTKESLRLEAIEAMMKCKESSQISRKIIQEVIDKIDSSQIRENDYLKSLREDLSGQSMIAVSNPLYFQKWGQHYLPSLAMAHTHKLCTNFKDPGVQSYAGELFENQRDSIEKVFMSIEPPEPTHKKNPEYSQEYYRMMYYKDALCFDGESEVFMANGTNKKVKNIQKDDLIYCPRTGKQERVRCVIQTQVKDSVLPMVHISQGLSITPYHPIKYDGSWVFPCNVSAPKMTFCPSIYSFLLESGHTMSINGVECVTFAHGFEENVVKHDYFGTQNIIRDLRWMKGYWRGHIILNDSPTIRDHKTNQVKGLQNNRKWMATLQQFQQNSWNDCKNFFFSKVLKLTKRVIKI